MSSEIGQAPLAEVPGNEITNESEYRCSTIGTDDSPQIGDKFYNMASARRKPRLDPWTMTDRIDLNESPPVPKTEVPTASVDWEQYPEQQPTRIL